jgi:lipopolysaccharide biosynthesis protein
MSKIVLEVTEAYTKRRIMDRISQTHILVQQRMEGRDVLPDKFRKKKYKLEEIYDLKKGSHAKRSTANFYLFRLQLNLYKEKITQKWFTIKVILYIKYLQAAPVEVQYTVYGFSQATEKST